MYIDLNSIVINEEIAVQIAIILLLLKLLTTGITFALGGMGGGFAPAIYIGILAGYITSNFIYIGNCANVLGMVGLMAGYSNAPIATAILFSGIMGDFNLFIPFLALGIISSFINKKLRKNP